jgi:hypothetical protein
VDVGQLVTHGIARTRRRIAHLVFSSDPLTKLGS